MVTMAFGRHQSNRKIIPQLILTKNDEYDDYSLIILALVFTQDIRSGVTLLIVFPIIIIFMIVLGYAQRSKRDKQRAFSKCFPIILLIPYEELTR